MKRLKSHTKAQITDNIIIYRQFNQTKRLHTSNAFSTKHDRIIAKRYTIPDCPTAFIVNKSKCTIGQYFPRHLKKKKTRNTDA